MYIIHYVSISISLLIISLIAGCGNQKFEPPKTDFLNSDSIPTQESFKPIVTFSDSGKVKAILKAGRIRQYARFNYTIIDSGAVVDFYKAGVYTSTLTGKRGKIFDLTKDVEVYDSVSVVSQDGSDLRTSKLYWANKTQKIRTDEFVHIKTKTDDISGYGFESDQNLKNYVIYKVSGQVQR